MVVPVVFIGQTKEVCNGHALHGIEVTAHLSDLFPRLCWRVSSVSFCFPDHKQQIPLLPNELLLLKKLVTLLKHRVTPLLNRNKHHKKQQTQHTKPKKTPKQPWPNWKRNKKHWTMQKPNCKHKLMTIQSATLKKWNVKFNWLDWNPKTHCHWIVLNYPRSCRT